MNGDRSPAGSPAPVRPRHDAVAEATCRTRHEMPRSIAERDPRYTSPDPETDRLWQALHEVADPELPISLVDLGLVYRIRREASHVHVDLTFTATACPCMAFIREDVRDRLLCEPGVEVVEIHEVWDPPWTAEHMTAAGRELLRGFGVAA